MARGGYAGLGLGDTNLSVGFGESFKAYEGTISEELLTSGIVEYGKTYQAEGMLVDVPDLTYPTLEEAWANKQQKLVSPDKERNPVLSQEEAQARADSLGIPFSVPKEGITQDHLELVLDRRSRQNLRRLKTDLGPGGASALTAMVGGGLWAFITDPLEVAAAVVTAPIAAARYANTLKNTAGVVGRAGVHAKYGLITGVAAEAAIEPFRYGLNTYNDYEYDLIDSFANVAIGGLFNAGVNTAIHLPKELRVRSMQNKLERARAIGGEIDARMQPRQLEDFIHHLSRADNEILVNAVMADAMNGRRLGSHHILLEPIARDLEARANLEDRLVADYVKSLEDGVATEPPMSRGDIKALHGERKNLQHDLEKLEGQPRVDLPKDHPDYAAAQKGFQERQSKMRKMQKRISEIDAMLGKNHKRSQVRSDLDRAKQGILPKEVEARIRKEVDRQYPKKDYLATPDPDSPITQRQASDLMDFASNPRSLITDAPRTVAEVQQRVDAQDVGDSVDELIAMEQEALERYREVLGDEFVTSGEMEDAARELQELPSFIAGMRRTLSCLI